MHTGINNEPKKTLLAKNENDNENMCDHIETELMIGEEHLE